MLELALLFLEWMEDVAVRFCAVCLSRRNPNPYKQHDKASMSRRL